MSNIVVMIYNTTLSFVFINNKNNLAKLDDGLDESPTVMVVETTPKKSNSVKIGAY